MSRSLSVRYIFSSRSSSMGRNPSASSLSRCGRQRLEAIVLINGFRTPARILAKVQACHAPRLARQRRLRPSRETSESGYSVLKSCFVIGVWGRAAGLGCTGDSRASTDRGDPESNLYSRQRASCCGRRLELHHGRRSGHNFAIAATSKASRQRLLAGRALLTLYPRV